MNTYDKGDVIADRVNLLSPNIFILLPNLKTITVETKASGTAQYSFNLLCFLENILYSTKWKKIVIQYLNRDDSTGGWISYLWEISASDIKREYEKRGLKILFEKHKLWSVQGGTWYKECLIITRING